MQNLIYHRPMMKKAYANNMDVDNIMDGIIQQQQRAKPANNSPYRVKRHNAEVENVVNKAFSEGPTNNPRTWLKSGDRPNIPSNYPALKLPAYQPGETTKELKQRAAGGGDVDVQLGPVKQRGATGQQPISTGVTRESTAKAMAVQDALDKKVKQGKPASANFNPSEVNFSGAGPVNTKNYTQLSYQATGPQKFDQSGAKAVTKTDRSWLKGEDRPGISPNEPALKYPTRPSNKGSSDLSKLSPKQPKVETPKQPKVETPKVNTQPPPSSTPTPEKGFSSALKDTFNARNPLNKYQPSWEKGVQSFGGTLKKGLSESLASYAAKGAAPQTGIKGMAFNAVTGALKDGGMFDKGVKAVARHGLKAPMVAALGGGALLGGKMLGGALSSNAGILIPMGLSIASGLAKDKGFKGTSKGIGMAGDMIKSVFQKKGNLSNEDRYILMKMANDNQRYIPDGFEPIEDTDMTKQAAKLPPINSEADLMELLVDVPSEIREKIWYGMSQLRKRDALQKARDFSITTSLGITGGVASNILTDKLRQKTGNPNKPVVVIANNKTNAKAVVDRINKQGSTLSNAMESLKTAQSKDFISHALENVQKFSKNNPKLTPYLLGIATPFVAPYAIDSTTRLIGEGQRFATSQYNNLNYGYGAPGYSPYMSGYGGGVGYGAY